MKEIFVKGRDFVDESGNKLIFHGINICYKGENTVLFNKKKKDMWAKRTYFDHRVPKEELELLASMGINLIRLGVTWDAIEPEMGVYDEDNIDCIIDMVRDASDVGIYVLIDMHQDLYAGFGNDYGDGAPRWATLTDGIEHRYPKLVWAEGYFSDDAVMHAFDNFWHNTEVEGVGLQDRYIAMWVHLVERLKGADNIFGYDVMNEPFGGSSGRKIFKTLLKAVRHTMLHDRSFRWSKFLSGFIPGMYHNLFDAFTGEFLSKVTSYADAEEVAFDRECYNPFLNKIATAIRRVDKKGIITIDNNYFSNLGVKMGLEPIVVDGERDPKQCFSPHGYDLMVDTAMYNYASNDRIDTIFDAHRAKGEELDMPILVGEWGCMCFRGKRWHQHIKHLYEYFDRHDMSNIYWLYNNFMFSTYNAYMYMRPYCREINGKILEERYDYDSNTYTIRCKTNGSSRNLVLYFPLEPLEYDSEYVNITRVNTASKLEHIKRYYREVTKPKAKWNRYVVKNMLRYDFSECIGASVLEYNLPEGEHTITIKMTRSWTQKDRYSKRDYEYYGANKRELKKIK